MKRFLSLATAATIALTFATSVSARMMDKGMLKEKSKGEAMNMVMRHMMKTRRTTRSIREAKVKEDLKRPVRPHPVRAYFIPKSSSSSSMSSSSATSSESSSAASSTSSQ